MARRKKDEPKGAAGWITTFSDLMNLLLCFFIMLFAMSTIDQEKFQELVVSMSASFGVFEGSSTSVIEGTLVSSGVADLNDLGEKYQDMGLNFEGTSLEISQNLEDYKDQQVIEMYSQSEEIQEDVENQLEESGISDQVEVKITAQYVQLTLSGSILFESGSADIKSESLPYLSKTANILAGYKGNLIEIIGHTDNIPFQGSSKYADNIDLSMARAKVIALYLVDNNGLEIKDILFSGKGEYDPIVSNSTTEGRAQNRRVEIRIFNDLSTEQSGE